MICYTGFCGLCSPGLYTFYISLRKLLWNCRKCYMHRNNKHEHYNVTFWVICEACNDIQLSVIKITLCKTVLKIVCIQLSMNMRILCLNNELKLNCLCNLIIFMYKFHVHEATLSFIIERESQGCITLDA
jgi:hypothetical protein